MRLRKSRPVDEIDRDIERVIDAHLRPGVTLGTGISVGLDTLPRGRLGRFLSMLTRPLSAEEVSREYAALLDVLDLGPEAREQLSRAFTAGGKLGVDTETALPILQAYVRGISRIVDAEAAALRRRLRDLEPDERVGYLERVLPAGLGASRTAFEAIHLSLLRVALADELTSLDLRGDEMVSVAMVDICKSTPYLTEASAEETERLVDVLFEAGQASTRGRPVRVMKHVGDGLFLVGRETRAVAAAAFDAIDTIERGVPLRARAGVAYGRAVRRSGDYFGLPVTIAQVLTEIAPPGTVVATHHAARTLPEDMRTPSERVEMRGGSLQLRVATLVRPSAADLAVSPDR